MKYKVALRSTEEGFSVSVPGLHRLDGRAQEAIHSPARQASRQPARLAGSRISSSGNAGRKWSWLRVTRP